MPGTCSCTHGFTRRFLLPPGGPWTSETDSRPPAIITGTLSTSTRWAAIEMVCRPDEQKRLTVTPETLTGAPARIAETRATLEPVVPSGAAQPRITSSTSARSILARSAACLMTWAPRSAPWVSLNTPRKAFPIGVRAVETMTASAIGFSFPQTRIDQTVENFLPSCTSFLSSGAGSQNGSPEASRYFRSASWMVLRPTTLSAHHIGPPR